MVERVYNFKVEMTCEGCSNALQKVLDKHKSQGITDFTIDLPGQQVTIKSASLSPDEVLNIVKKTGKTSSFLNEQTNN